MSELQKRLEEFAKTYQKKEKEFKDLLLFEYPDLLPNLEEGMAVLNNLESDEIRKDYVIGIARTREYEYDNRPHKIGEYVKTYNYFKSILPTSTLSQKEFTKVYKSINTINIGKAGNELSTEKKKMALLIDMMKDAGIDKEEQLKMISYLSENINAFVQELNRINKKANNSEQSLKLKDIYDLVRKTKNYNHSDFVDALKTVLYEEKYNDILLENNFVYYQVSKRVKKDQQLLVLNPSIFFVEKWIADNDVYHIKTIFVFFDKRIADITKKKYDDLKNIKIVSSQELDEITRTELNEKEYFVFVFGNHSKEKQTIIECLDLVLETKMSYMNIGIIDSDATLESDKSDLHKYLLENKLVPKDIQILPQKINSRTDPSKKLLAFFIKESDSKKEENVLITRWRLKTDKKYQYIDQYPVYYKYPYSEFLEGKKRIRRRFEELLKKQKTGKQKITYRYEFSDEIVFEYTLSDNKKEKQRCRLNVFALTPENKDGKRERIPESKKATNKLPADEIEKWIEEEYPYLNATDKKTTIRKIISESYIGFYQNKPLSMKSFVYLYGIDEQFDKEEKEILKELKQTEIYNTRMDIHETEDVVKDVNAKYEGFDKLEKNETAIKVLAKIYDKAIAAGHAENNPLAEQVIIMARSEKALRQVKNALMRRCFTQQETRKIYKHIKGKIDKGQREYIAVAIKLFTGIETNIVCAMKWKDLTILEDFSDKEKVYQLSLSRRINEKKFDKLLSKESYRKIPLSRKLAEILLKEKQKQMEELGIESEETMAEHSIIRGKDIVLNGVTEMMSPARLNDLCRRVLKQCFKMMEDLEVKVSKTRKKTINFSKYKGDIFRSNFKHHAIHVAGFDQGEVDYLIGNIPSVTFGRNYADYDSDSLQYLLYVKINRMDTLFEKESDFISNKTAKTENNYICQGSKNYLYELSFVVDAEETKIEIESDHGVDVVVSEYKE